jgi:malate dehydrogenase (oxaloacetate-decarboxylating)
MIAESTSTIRTSLAGYDLLNNPRLNKGTAFSDPERDSFALHGLLPPHVGTLNEQVARRKKALARQPSDFDQYSFLRDLQDSNETLFYALLMQSVEEMLPLVYTPTVGEGCQRFSETWRKARGLFISYPNRGRIDEILSHPRYDSVKCIVVSDGERILGLGDQGAGGMGIPIGKMALYTALGGVHPEHCLPILLDVGTDNADRLHDPIYIGWSHERVRGQEYDDFVERFVSAVKARWPWVLLQWEDFAKPNAARLLDKYRDQLCTFNDDIQGTAAVATATLLAAVGVTGAALKDQRIAFYGFGSAGIGIANYMVQAIKDEGLSDGEARKKVYAIDRNGLIVEGAGDTDSLALPYARRKDEIAGWKIEKSAPIGLQNVIREAKITVLIGVSGQAGAFTEPSIRAMAKNTDRPIIFPLSNPTSREEATPQQLLDWTNGRALIGTGSPFPPVEVSGRKVKIDQTNNSYIFPGLALGIIASRARRVSDSMIMASAKKLAELSPARKDKTANLLPAIVDARKISRTIAEAVGRQALAEGLAGLKNEGELESELDANIWEPVYVPYEHIPPA